MSTSIGPANTKRTMSPSEPYRPNRAAGFGPCDRSTTRTARTAAIAMLAIALLAAGTTMGQLLSLPLVLGGAWLIHRALRTP